MDRESFLLSLKLGDIKQLNQIIEQNGKKPRLMLPITKYNSTNNKSN